MSTTATGRLVTYSASVVIENFHTIAPKLAKRMEANSRDCVFFQELKSCWRVNHQVDCFQQMSICRLCSIGTRKKPGRNILANGIYLYMFQWIIRIICANNFNWLFRDLIAFTTEPLLVHPSHYTNQPGYVSDTEKSVLLPVKFIPQQHGDIGVVGVNDTIPSLIPSPIPNANSPDIERVNSRLLPPPISGQRLLREELQLFLLLRDQPLVFTHVCCANYCNILRSILCLKCFYLLPVSQFLVLL